MQDSKDTANQPQTVQIEDKKQRGVTPVQFQATQIQYSGPIPPAAEMAHYA